MIYSAHADAKIYIGGWPQFFKAVFHVDAKSEEEARNRAKQTLEASPAMYEKLHIEYLGRRFEVLSNEEFSIAGINYKAGSVSSVSIFEGTMQICVNCVRYGRQDHDNIGLWDDPVRFKEMTERVFSKMKYKEI